MVSVRGLEERIVPAEYQRKTLKVAVPERQPATITERFCEVLILQIFHRREICESRDDSQAGIDKRIAGQNNREILCRQVNLDLMVVLFSFENANLLEIHNSTSSQAFGLASFLVLLPKRAGKLPVPPDRMLPDMEKFSS